MFYKLVIAMITCCIQVYCSNPIEGIDQMVKNNGSFLVRDNAGNWIILEWSKIVGKSEKLNERIKNLSGLFTPAYVRQEVEFARECTDVTTSNDLEKEFMLKSLAYLFDQGKDNVDWKLFEEKTGEVLHNFFTSTNWGQYSSDGDVSIFVVAIDQKSGKELGAVQLLSTPAFAPNNIKIGLFGVVDMPGNHQIKQMLISSVFRLFPDVARLFLHTRSTDIHAIALYQSWGFVTFPGTLPHWTDLEYIVNHNDVLQSVAATFELIS